MQEVDIHVGTKQNRRGNYHRLVSFNVQVTTKEQESVNCMVRAIKMATLTEGQMTLQRIDLF